MSRGICFFTLTAISNICVSPPGRLLFGEGALFLVKRRGPGFHEIHNSLSQPSDLARQYKFVTINDDKRFQLLNPAWSHVVTLDDAGILVDLFWAWQRGAID